MTTKPFNEQAALLVENCLDLIKQVLVKHTAAVLEEMRDQIVSRNKRISELERERNALDDALRERDKQLIAAIAERDELQSRLDYSLKREYVIRQLAAVRLEDAPQHVAAKDGKPA